MMFGFYCCCGDCMPKFVNVEIARVGFRQLTGHSFNRWLTQHYTYDFSYRQAIPDTFPVEYEIIEWNYELTLTIDRYSGQFTTITETSNLDSTQVANMHARLNALDLGSATDTASGSNGDIFGGGLFGGLIVWSIELTSPVDLSADITELDSITTDALAIVATEPEIASSDPYWIHWNSASRVGYPNYGNTQMIPFYPKANTVGKTAALDTDVQVLFSWTGNTFLAASGYWYFFPTANDGLGLTFGGSGATAEDMFPVVKYPCNFREQGAVFFALNNPKHAIARQVVQFGSVGAVADQSLCAQFTWQGFDSTGALTGSPTTDYIGGSDGLVVFPLPEVDTLSIATNAKLTMPGYVDGSSCSMAP